MEVPVENIAVNSEQEINELEDRVFGLAAVPWKNKAEWFEIYKKVYSGNHIKQNEAYNVMQKWQTCKSDCPLGIICTSAMLQGILKDLTFYPNGEHMLDENELKFIYGGAITRFLNFLASAKISTAQVESKKMVESFYSKAKKLGIPDWIVNVRHEIAHGTQLPAIDLLRLCVIYIMNFLKKSYWEIENKKIEDVSTTNIPRNVTLKETFLKLINIYIKIKEQRNKTILLSMADTELREEVLKANENRLVSERLKNAPWEINYLKFKKTSEITKDLMKYTLDRCWKFLVKFILEYRKVDVINVWQLITSRMIEDSIVHKCVRLNIWAGLIKAISDIESINNILESLMSIIFKQTNSSEITYWAKKWTIIILQALLKRSNAEKLKQAIIGKHTYKQGWWGRRVIFTMNKSKRDNLKQLLVKTKHDPSKRVRIIAIAALILVVEKKIPQLRSSLRFTCNPLDLQTIKDYIHLVCLEPSDFSKIALDFFVHMLPYPHNKLKKPLNLLLNSYEGKRLSSMKMPLLNELYTLQMALKKNEDVMNDIEECLEKGPFLDKSMKNYLRSSEKIINDKPIHFKASFKSVERRSCLKVLEMPWQEL